MQRRTLYLLTLLECVWFASLWHSAMFGILNYDEAWYLTASHLVFNGQLLYRDFAFTQGPLMPYVYGAALWLLGANLAVGRFVSVGLAMLATALVLNMAHRMAGMRAALLTFLLLLAAPDVLYYFAIVKTYSLSATLTLLALAMVLHGNSSSSTRFSFLSTFSAGMAALTRISFLPVVVFVFLFWTWRKKAQASGLGLLIPALSTLMLSAISNGNLFFDILGFHLGIAPTVDSTLSVKTTLAFASAIGFSSALAMALFLFVLWARSSAFRGRLAAWWRIQMDTKVLVLIAAIALGIVHFAAPGNFREYQVPGYLLVAVLLAATSSLVGGVMHQSLWTLLLAVCILVSSAPAWMYRFPELWRPTNTLLAAGKASLVLAQTGMQGNTVLGEFNHLAVASGLQIYPGNEMGRFSIAAELPAPEATLRRLLSKEAVTDALTSCSATFAVTERGQLFPISVPSTLDISAATQNQWRDLLRENYRMIYSDGDLTIFERIEEKCSGAQRTG